MTTRRNFIRQSLAVSAGIAGLNQFLSIPALAMPKRMMQTDEKWLELPEGFTARMISKWGDKMSDGFFVPGKGDGMAAFNLNEKVVVIRNHENSPLPAKFGPYGEDMALFSKVNKLNAFDYGYGKTPGLGGTTTLIYNESKQVVEQQFLSLTGTYRNCAGGPTPWGSWLSCEEDTSPKSETSETKHGYNFEVPAANKKLLTPVPLKEMGRFNHEAVCVDPTTGIVYQTEDRSDSLIYRFIPKEPEKLHLGGTLQALVIRASKAFDTRNWETPTLNVGETVDVEWITLSDVDADADDLRLRGHAQGAALFARGEGMWYGNKEIYFACTNGGAKKCGQVFKYIPSPSEGKKEEKDNPGKLVLFAEPNNMDILKFCDNLTVSPWGDVILVEDSKDSYIRGITPEGKIYNIGRNVGSDSELAGLCFSPSGKTLFVNVQTQGLTFAITGPWNSLRK
ncbi:alkaline phosphatase PhoX [Chryseolinea sp. H1M3-3]|uniref:alkaline phosphatase PhoX n=1 Tax=Chryseolinea sp. H1M3-3 TaxID=3034144 RepID=UPI0023EAB409|nr:alkaline phosphatase PhoX [Chryseolinea sp. H1M3-3]